MTRSGGRLGPFGLGLAIGLAVGTLLGLTWLSFQFLRRPGDSAERPGSPPAQTGDPRERAPHSEEIGGPAAVDLDTEANALVDRVREHLRERRWERARREIASFREAIPNEATRQRYEGLLEESLARVQDEERIAAGKQARTLPPGATPLHLERELRPIWDLAVAARKSGRSHEALAHVDRLLDLAPAVLSFWLYRARLLVDLTEFEKARDDADAAVALIGADQHSPELLAELFEFRAEIALLLLDFAGAESNLHRTLDHAPDSTTALLMLADVDRVRGASDRAIETFRSLESRSMSANDNIIRYHVGLGLALIVRGSRAEALESLGAGMARVTHPLERHGLAALRAFAWIHPACGPADVERARAILDAEAPRLSSMMLPAYLVHGAVQELTGHHEQAYSAFEVVGRRWTIYPEFGVYYARAARANGRAEEASSLLQMLHRIRPELTESFEGAPR